MSTIEVARQFAESQIRLYELITDLPRMGEWSPENTGGRWIVGDGPVVGARFKGTNRRNWLRWTTDAKVTKADPGKAFEFIVSLGPLKNLVTWGYRFEPNSTGTLVTEYHQDHRSHALRLVAGSLSGIRDPDMHYKAGMEHTLEQLARAVES
jgi:Polyketide cyclase / dehydrase and lipid transport